MNKLLIGLLLVAAAAGVFFYLRKQDKPIANDDPKERLIGTWRLESIKSENDSTNMMIGLIASLDSNTFRYDYEFTKEQAILRRLGDSTTTDTSRYAWNENDLVWHEDRSDTAGSRLAVLTLNTDSLLLRSNDSTLMLFTRRK